MFGFLPLPLVLTVKTNALLDVGAHSFLAGALGSWSCIEFLMQIAVQLDPIGRCPVHALACLDIGAFATNDVVPGTSCTVLLERLIAPMANPMPLSMFVPFFSSMGQSKNDSKGPVGVGGILNSVSSSSSSSPLSSVDTLSTDSSNEAGCLIVEPAMFEEWFFTGAR